MSEILVGAERLISQLIRQELYLQGHYLSGTAANSIKGRTSKIGQIDRLTGTGVDYLLILDEGLRPNQISFKMVGPLIGYFKKRGLIELEARKAAINTVKKWMREGMSTQASKRFSKTGARQNVLDAVFIGYSSVIDDYMSNTLDFAVDEEYRKTKSETI